MGLCATKKIILRLCSTHKRYVAPLRLKIGMLRLRATVVIWAILCDSEQILRLKMGTLSGPFQLCFNFAQPMLQFWATQASCENVEFRSQILFLRIMFCFTILFITLTKKCTLIIHQLSFS